MVWNPKSVLFGLVQRIKNGLGMEVTQAVRYVELSRNYPRNSLRSVERQESPPQAYRRPKRLANVLRARLAPVCWSRIRAGK
jgi:hypothetical protein